MTSSLRHVLLAVQEMTQEHNENWSGFKNMSNYSNTLFTDNETLIKRT